ncbi:copper amine oxidase N-terminal domain-containing protein [Paenibacillus aurantius]|uniref:Copper amine oxidase N-terminal domain-containing protein n=1 Tax=Paenibacillus aurantius TaxID=2918900 RepID=A0AA96LI03_9BACL|nr:copper amine oxidase N-terminal domain-containing protein [Paenibacillus aurantius]WNQ12470.1 copper amine oxidase N-terminal domain-containing protein [Paenibacillus aurantius]
MRLLKSKLALLLLCFSILLPAAASAHTPATTGPAADLRAALGQLLGEHAFLAIAAMQKGYDGAPDFNSAAGALNKNTDDLTAAVASVYGKEAGDAFKAIWSSHIGYFVDYVKATAAKDEKGRQAAVANLEKYRFEQADFFAKANPAYFKADAIADGLKMHINHLLMAFDSYVNKDYANTYKDLRTAYAHMFLTADALAGGIAAQFPDKFPSMGQANPASDLRSALGRLLGEHANLAILAMQKGISGAADFPNAAGALGENTDDLTAAVASVYGKEAGEAFKTIWSSHIGYFVDYVKATAVKDEKGRQAAVANLEKYRFEQADFFAKANPAYFKADAIADGLKMHINHLLMAFDTYVNKNYDAAYGDIRTAYAHMFLTGDALSAGIVGQFPDKFHGPADMAKTTVWMKLNSGEFRINNAVTYMDTTPFLYHESTFIPIRYLAEGLGAEVTWDNNTQTAWIKAGSDTLTFWIGKNYMEVNGMRKEIGSPVMLHGGRTSVPVRFIAELLGWDVQWNNSDRSVTLTKAMDMNH